MKKFLLSIVVVFFAVIVNAQSTQTYNFSATVSQYIEVNPSNAILDVADVGTSKHIILDPGSADAEILATWPSFKGEFFDNVYANCPFTITYSGEPVLSREEVNGNGTDRLQTFIAIANQINNYWGDKGPGYQVKRMTYKSGPEGAATGTYTGQTTTFTEAPHNGEVYTFIEISAALPHVTPEFGVDNTWNQSADAGAYAATLMATYAVIPW